MLSQTIIDSGLLVRYGIRYDINDIGLIHLAQLY